MSARVIPVRHVAYPDDEPLDWYAFCGACGWYGDWRQEPQRAESDAAQHRCELSTPPGKPTSTEETT